MVTLTSESNLSCPSRSLNPRPRFRVVSVRFTSRIPRVRHREPSTQTPTAPPIGFQPLGGKRPHEGTEVSCFWPVSPLVRCHNMVGGGRGIGSNRDGRPVLVGSLLSLSQDVWK